MKTHAFVFILALTLTLLASGDLRPQDKSKPKDVGSAQEQLKQLRNEIKKIADQQRELEAERGGALKQLRDSDAKVAQTARSLRDAESKMSAQQKQILELERQQQTLEIKQQERKKALEQLVKASYRLGQAPALKLMLSQDQISEANRTLTYYRYLQQAQQQQLDAINLQQQEITRVRESLLSTQTQLQASTMAQKNALTQLSVERAQRGELLDSLDSEYQDRKKRLSALGRDEKNLQNVLAQLRRAAARAAQSPRPSASRTKPPRASSFAPRAQAGLPLSGTLIANYGGALPDGHRSNGWLIAAPSGSNVRAVAAGQVVYADWLKGYGLLLIIDHGSGWMSLYAFNDALLKNAGDSVREGEAISTVGTSGGQSQPALYFELRLNGQPQDPSRAAAL
jgi:murein hydrolase activator